MTKVDWARESAVFEGAREIYLFIYLMPTTHKDYILYCYKKKKQKS